MLPQPARGREPAPNRDAANHERHTEAERVSEKEGGARGHRFALV